MRYILFCFWFYNYMVDEGFDTNCGQGKKLLVVLFLKKESLPSLLSYFFFLIIISKFLIDKPIIFNPKDKPPEILHPDIKISFPYEFIKIWQSQISFTTLYTIKSNPRFLPFNFFFPFDNPNNNLTRIIKSLNFENQ